MTEAAAAPSILVVDDEPLIRMFACDIATDAGFRVVQACNSHDALAEIESDPQIGIVFTDVQMPGSMDGLALSRAARERRPSIRFLIVSGHRKPDAGELPAESKFFSKPYRAEDITDALGALARDWRNPLDS